MKTTTLKHCGLLASLLLTIVLTTLPARAQLGPPDLNVLTDLRDNFGWGAVFGWTNGNPCPPLPDDPNWNGVSCQSGRVSKLDMTCGAVKLNAPPFPHLIYMSQLKELSLRSCFTGGIQATQFSANSGGAACSGFCGPITRSAITTKLRFDTGQTINGTIDELFRQSETPPAQSGLNPTRFPVLTTLYLTDTKMSGTIPDGVMLFTSATDIRLNYASFSGSLPATGNASKNLWLNGNQLEGTLPDYIRNATGNVSVRYNKFDVVNTPAGSIDTLDPLWRTTQTVPPTGVIVSSLGAGTATLAWTPIAYQQHGGYYEVLSSQTAGGPYTSRGTTENSGGKTASSLVVAGLPAGINYFIVRTFTPAHTGVFPMGCTQEVDCVTENNPNNLTSINSAETNGNIPASLTVTKTADTNDGTCDADCSLREAIAAANATATSETITFDIPANDAGCASGVCTITLGGTQLTINNAATAGTLTISNPNGTAANLRVSGNNASRVFNVVSGANLTLDNLTVKGGRVTGSNNFGGGIFNNGGTLTLTNCAVSNNVLSGINNVGGGIYSGGTLTLTNSTVSGNALIGGTNSFSRGGGVASELSTVNITNSTISNNSASGTGNDGGGIYALGGTLNITGSTISNNSALGGSNENYGGGIYSRQATLNLTNSTVSGNSVTGSGNNQGGGIRSSQNPINLTGSTISNNSAIGGTANIGGGIFDEASSTIKARNSIISGNTAASSPEFNAGFNVNDSNLIGNAAQVRLAPLGFYGGATMTHALLSGSTAINAGNNCVLTQTCTTFNAPIALTSDQRGASRVGQVDIGAFELNNSANGGNFAADLPNGTQNVGYNFQIAPNNGAFTYSVTGGALPNGVSLSTNIAPNAVVALSGTPTNSGTFNFAVTASDGTNSNVTNYSLQVFGPTAASVSIGGRVMSTDGRGIRNAIVMLTLQNGETIQTRSSSFGYFRFDGIEAGQTVVVSVISKRFQFAPQIVSVNEELTELNFIAQ